MARISVDLKNIFQDIRSSTYLLLDERFKTVQDLENHIRSIFGIPSDRLISLTCNGHLLPSTEPIGIIGFSDTIVVVFADRRLPSASTSGERSCPNKRTANDTTNSQEGLVKRAKSNDSAIISSTRQSSSSQQIQQTINNNGEIRQQHQNNSGSQNDLSTSQIAIRQEPVESYSPQIPSTSSEMSPSSTDLSEPNQLMFPNHGRSNFQVPYSTYTWRDGYLCGPLLNFNNPIPSNVSTLVMRQNARPTTSNMRAEAVYNDSSLNRYPNATIKIDLTENEGSDSKIGDVQESTGHSEGYSEEENCSKPQLPLMSDESADKGCCKSQIKKDFTKSGISSVNSVSSVISRTSTPSGAAPTQQNDHRNIPDSKNSVRSLQSLSSESKSERASCSMNESKILNSNNRLHSVINQLINNVNNNKIRSDKPRQEISECKCFPLINDCSAMNINPIGLEQQTTKSDVSSISTSVKESPQLNVPVNNLASTSNNEILTLEEASHNQENIKKFRNTIKSENVKTLPASKSVETINSHKNDRNESQSNQTNNVVTQNMKVNNFNKDHGSLVVDNEETDYETSTSFSINDEISTEAMVVTDAGDVQRDTKIETIQNTVTFECNNVKDVQRPINKPEINSSSSLTTDCNQTRGDFNRDFLENSEVRIQTEPLKRKSSIKLSNQAKSSREKTVDEEIKTLNVVINNCSGLTECKLNGHLVSKSGVCEVTIKAENITNSTKYGYFNEKIKDLVKINENEDVQTLDISINNCRSSNDRSEVNSYSDYCPTEHTNSDFNLAVIKETSEVNNSLPLIIGNCAIEVEDLQSNSINSNIPTNNNAQIKKTWNCTNIDIKKSDVLTDKNESEVKVGKSNQRDFAVTTTYENSEKPLIQTALEELNETNIIVNESKESIASHKEKEIFNDFPESSKEKRDNYCIEENCTSKEEGDNITNTEVICTQTREEDRLTEVEDSEGRDVVDANNHRSLSGKRLRNYSGIGDILSILRQEQQQLNTGGENSGNISAVNSSNITNSSKFVKNIFRNKIRKRTRRNKKKIIQAFKNLSNDANITTPENLTHCFIEKQTNEATGYEVNSTTIDEFTMKTDDLSESFERMMNDADETDGFVVENQQNVSSSNEINKSGDTQLVLNESSAGISEEHNENDSVEQADAINGISDSVFENDYSMNSSRKRKRNRRKKRAVNPTISSGPDNFLYANTSGGQVENNERTRLLTPVHIRFDE